MNDVQANLSVNIKNMNWSKKLDILFKKWMCNASSYTWLHKKSEEKYLNYNNKIFVIPIILLNIFLGTFSFIFNDTSCDNKTSFISHIVFGILNFFVGGLTTVQNVYNYSQLSEKHRQAGLLWEKFYRTLNTELSLPFMVRGNAKDFLINTKHDYDKIIEVSPQITGDILESYIKEHKITMSDILTKIKSDSKYKSKTSLCSNDLILEDNNDKVINIPNSDSESSDNNTYLDIVTESESEYTNTETYNNVRENRNNIDIKESPDRDTSLDQDYKNEETSSNNSSKIKDKKIVKNIFLAKTLLENINDNIITEENNSSSALELEEIKIT